MPKVNKPKQNKKITKHTRSFTQKICRSEIVKRTHVLPLALAMTIIIIFQGNQEYFMNNL